MADISNFQCEHVYITRSGSCHYTIDFTKIPEKYQSEEGIAQLLIDIEDNGVENIEGLEWEENEVDYDGNYDRSEIDYFDYENKIFVNHVHSRY